MQLSQSKWKITWWQTQYIPQFLWHRHSIFHSFYDSSCLRSSNINYCWIAIILIIHFFSHNYHLCSLSSRYLNQLVWIANITLNSNECSSNSLNNTDRNSMSFLLINLYTHIAVVLNFKEHKNNGKKVVKVESVLLNFDMI